MDNALFPPEQKDAVYNKSDLLSVYMHGKGTQEDPCYFDEELSSENDNDNKEIENNKIDNKNKENIPNKPLRVLASDKVVQILPI